MKISVPAKDVQPGDVIAGMKVERTETISVDHDICGVCAVRFQAYDVTSSVDGRTMHLRCDPRG